MTLHRVGVYLQMPVAAGFLIRRREAPSILPGEVDIWKALN